jgi:hypothetical protein
LYIKEPFHGAAKITEMIIHDKQIDRAPVGVGKYSLDPYMYTRVYIPGNAAELHPDFFDHDVPNRPEVVV